MGREVRMVPENWDHPKDDKGRKQPLMGGYAKDAKQFLEMANKEGLQKAVDYFGRAPDQEHYMPEWPASECTHLMMYETCSEGTPISPAFKTPEELARWLADNNASSFGDCTATYGQWLAMIGRGWAISAYVDGTGVHSGVELASEKST